MVRKPARKWNPSLHPRDARGRFTRSSTRVLKGTDSKRAKSALTGFTAAKITNEADGRSWYDANAGARPAPDSELGRYLGGGWRETNPAIRAQKTPPPGVAEIDAEFSELKEDLVLRRQVPLKMFAHIPIPDLVGMKVRDAAYASTALDRPDAGPSAPDAVTMHIATPAGTLAYVNAPDGEILLARDTEVAITRAEPNGNGGWDLYGVVIPKTATTRNRRDTTPATDQGDDDGDDTSAADGASSRPTTGDGGDADTPDREPDSDATTGGRGRGDTPRAAAADQPDDDGTPPAATDTGQTIDGFDVPDTDADVREWYDELADAAAQLDGDNDNSRQARAVRRELAAARQAMQQRGLLDDAGRPTTPTPRRFGRRRPATDANQPAQSAAAPDGEPTPATPPAGSALAALPELDRERVRIGVEDHASRLYRNPMLGGASVENVARYTAEGALASVTDRHGLASVWRAVEEILNDRPELMTRTPDEADQAKAARVEQAEDLASQAAARMRDGDYAAALDLIDQAERISPDHLTGKPIPSRSWNNLRGIVRRREEKDRNAAAAADTSRPDGDSNPTDVGGGTDTPPADTTGAADVDPLDTTAEQDRQWIAPATGALAELAPIDRERVRIAVENNAGRINRTPMLGGSPGNVARYTAEGRDLADVTNRYGFRTAVQATRQIIDDRPDLMDRTDDDITAATAARRADATARATAADKALQRGDFTAARAEIDAGEAIDPDYIMDLPGPPFGWPQMRNIIDDLERERGNQRQPDAPNTDQPTPPAPRNEAEEYARNFTDEQLLAAVREVKAGKRQMARNVRTAIDNEIQHRGLTDRAAAAADDTPATDISAPDDDLLPPDMRQVRKLQKDIQRLETNLERARVANRANTRSPRELKIEGQLQQANRQLYALLDRSSTSHYGDMSDAELRAAGQVGNLPMRHLDAINAERRRRREQANQPAPQPDAPPAAGTRAPDAPEAPAADALPDGDDPDNGPDGPDDAGGGPGVPPPPSGPDSGPAGPATPAPDGDGGPAQQFDMFGGTTDFTPGARSTIGLAERPNLGRERAIAQVQQLGLFADESREMSGQMAMLDALLAMPAGEASAPPPDAPTMPEPAAPDTLTAPAAPPSLVPDDLAGWNDEQLAELFRQASEADDVPGLERIAGEWERREQAMADLVASVPDDLTALPEGDVMTWYARLTSELGTMDNDAVRRVGDELDRRQAAEAEAEANAPKRALLARPVGELTDEEVETAAGYAADLGDTAALERVMVEWDRRDQERERQAAREAAEQAAREQAEREAALQAAREAERRAAAEHAQAQQQRIFDAMAAAQAAAILTAYDDDALAGAAQILGEDGLRELFGGDRVDEWQAADPHGRGSRALYAGVRALPRSEQVRLVHEADRRERAREFAGWSDADLTRAVTAGVFATFGTPDYEEKKARAQRAGREKTQRKITELRRENLRQFRNWQLRAVGTGPEKLSDAELEVAPGLVDLLAAEDEPTMWGTAEELAARIDALRAEARRREAEAGRIAEAKAAGPAGPARYRNPVARLGDLRRALEYGNIARFDAEARDRLRRARALVHGLPEDADEKAIGAAERNDPRPVADQAAQVMAWYRHLARFEDLGETPRDEWRGFPDEDDVPDTPTPAPPANVAKPDEVWAQIQAFAQQEVADERYETAVRFVRAVARAYRIPADGVEPSRAGLSRIQLNLGSAIRSDRRTEKQRAADYLAQYRVLAAEDGIDPSDSLRYGPPDKATRKPAARQVWRDSTPDEQKRIDALVARGWDWLDAYAEVHGVDREALRVERAELSGGGRRRSEKDIRQAYTEYVEQQYKAAQEATAGHLLNKRAANSKVDPRSLFSGAWSTAKARASEELLRWWAEHPRLTYADFKAQLIGGEAAKESRERLIMAGKANEFA